MQKLMKRLHKSEKGFTLVELMVVVVIIGILVAIAIPVYQGIQANARNSACSANLRTLQGAIAQFYTEVGVYPPMDDTGDGAGGVQAGDDGVVVYGLAVLWNGYDKNHANVDDAEIIRFIEEEPLCPWNDRSYTYDLDVNSYVVVCEDTMCGNFGTP